MMHGGWLYTALCRTSRPSSYSLREPKHKASHLARIIYEPFSRIMRASSGCPRGHPAGRRTGWPENEPPGAIGQVVSASAQLDVLGNVPDFYGRRANHLWTAMTGL